MPPASASDPLDRQLQEAGRRLSAATIAFHRRVAAALGLNDTDHKCLDLLLREGSMTAGSLAARGGYTTGAVTGIINRLERKGFVRRLADPADARRVLLEADAQETHRRMWPLLMPMIHRMGVAHRGYTTEQLTLIHGYLEQTSQVLEDSAADLSHASDPQGKRLS